MSIKILPINNYSEELTKVPGIGSDSQSGALSKTRPGKAAENNMFSGIMEDRLAMEGFGGLDKQFFGTDDSNDDKSLFETTLTGEMGLLNTKAMGTVMSMMPMDQGAGNAIRRSLSPDTISAFVKAYQNNAAQQSGYEAHNQISNAFTATEAQQADNKPLGALAAEFESGENGSGAIGYDSSGGTSYGKYQISSRAGTMDRFISFLNKEAPEIAQQLQSAGKADTGSTQGQMPEIWKALASEYGHIFEGLQDDFISKNNYLPALEKILSKTDLKMENISPVISEVLFSTSVQHGPTGAADIFSKALSLINGGGGDISDSQLINTIYQLRKDDFPSLPESTRQAVISRLDKEKETVAAFLGADFNNIGA